MKRKLLLLPLLLSTLCLSGCFGLIPNPDGDSASDTSVDKSKNGNDRLSDKELTLVVGQTHTITLFSMKKDGTEVEFDNVNRWYEGSQLVVEDASIASVTQSGLVTALKIGTTKFLYYIGGVTTPLECPINVVEKEVQEVSLKRYKRKSLINTDYDTSNIVLSAKYQTGFVEPVTPTLIDDSQIDTSKAGEYNLLVYYTYNGVSSQATGKVKIVETESELIEYTELQHNIYELNYNSNLSTLPLSGNVKTLVVPVMFKDSGNYITNFANVKEDINTAFNGTSEETGFESVKTYYEKESFGKITFNATVSDWYEEIADIDYSYDYYDPDNQYDLAQKIKTWYFTVAHPEEDIKDYDANGDGFFDGLYLIYGSPDYETGGLGKAAEEMWMAMKGSNSGTPNVDDPLPNFFMWASFDTLYPSKAIARERTGNDFGYSEPEASGHHIDYERIHTHTLIHEVGHSFGIDDYYTYGDSTLYATEGNMQSGTILGHDPMSLLLYNWAKPIIPNETMTIDINDFQSSHDLILLTPEWNDIDSPFDEYILLELYTPTGLNQYDGLDHPKSFGDNTNVYNKVGFRIWHVDERLATRIGKDKTTHSDIVYDPTLPNVFEISDNTPSHNIDEFKNNFKLYLVRNDKTYDYTKASYMRNTDFFFEGDTFSLSDYASQFPYDGKLNSGKDLGWEVSIDAIYQTDAEKNTWGATITLTKKD